ncbi:MAG: H-type small acid-soluble spore protein [Firmicutes bacterium HGW-Firmicutes-14]|jgi:small acid-soluble spore protein H (minor)|nr:MAG: H-type small acid-soluble spore protein [Firmicutes bacterium HGW-Firmicutes-14]
MDYHRAQEIINSPDIIKVLYNNDPVWIEKLNPDKETALVSSDNLTGGEQNVQIEQLIETS